MAEGLYSNLSAQAKIPTGDAAYAPSNIAFLKDLRNKVWGKLLPAGRLKDALMSTDGSMLSAFKVIQSLLSGRQYRQGHYTLAERLIDQVQCQNGSADSVGWKDVPDELVPVARLFFTMVFGVRICTIEDLDALNGTHDDYWVRNKDMTEPAIERAQFLKKTYFPDSTYNTTCWDLSIFDKYPLVMPVPEMNADMFNVEPMYFKGYTGPGFNGVQFVDGLPTAESPSTPLTSVLQDEVDTAATQAAISNVTTWLQTNIKYVAIGLFVVFLLVLLIKKK